MFWDKEYSLNKDILKSGIRASFFKLNPKGQINNLATFTLYIGAIIVTLLYLVSFFGIKDTSNSFMFYVMLSLWLTVLAQNFAEAISEEKIRTEILRISGGIFPVYKISSIKDKGNPIKINSNELKEGDLIIIEAGEKIPVDGEIVEKEPLIEGSTLEQDKINFKTKDKDIKKSKNKDNEINKENRKTVKMGETLKFEWSIIKVLNCPNLKTHKAIKFLNKNTLELFSNFLMSIFICMAVSLYFYTKFLYAQSGTEESMPVTYFAALLVCLAPNLTKTNKIIKFKEKDNLHNKEKKQLFIEQGANLIFNISSDIAKYFCIIPCLFINLYPSFEVFNIMSFSSIESVIFSCIIYNILIIVFSSLIAVKESKYKEDSPNKLLFKNLTFYGICGFLISLIGIKLIDIIISSIRIF